MSREHSSPLRLGEIVGKLGGELIGDPDVLISKVGTLETAGAETISFLANERYLRQLGDTRAGAVIVGNSQRNATSLARIVSANPYAYFAKVSALLNPRRLGVPGRHQTAVVSPSAVVDESVEVGPYAVVEAGARIAARTIIGAYGYVGRDARIGSDTWLHPHVTVLDSCELGSRGILHSGVVIGADGFGIAMEDGRWIKVPQIGRVIIADDVEIGANTTVDRGAMDDTVIEDGVKLDNLIQVAHNVRIGAHTAIAACAGIAGSTRIGRYCRIGGASCISGHLVIADNVEISALTMVTKSIDQPGTYSGAYPFEANRAWRRNAASLRHLDELARRVAVLEKKLSELQGEKS